MYTYIARRHPSCSINPGETSVHGCIRVEKPAELAAWLLQDQPKWTLENIRTAMQSGPDNQQVNLSRPVPVVIVYLTAIVEENGEVYFYNDIYGLDGALNDALAKEPDEPVIQYGLPAAHRTYVNMHKVEFCHK